MNAKDFLIEEHQNAEQALSETLRFDQSRDRSAAFYKECSDRLIGIKERVDRTLDSDSVAIAVLIGEIYNLADLVCSIERAQIGDFSWVFADDLRSIAKRLLKTADINGEHSPIIHIMSDGFGYMIGYPEIKIPPPSCNDRFVSITFPRTLKNYVLLHAIFGHELAHPALFCKDPRVELTNVLDVFSRVGPLQNTANLSAWMHDNRAPPSVQGEMNSILAATGRRYAISDMHLMSWRIELMCDLFGLLLYGPAFMAAELVLLAPLHPDSYLPYLEEPTHPPFAVRQKMLLRAMRLLGWDHCLLDAGCGEPFEREQKFIAYLMDDTFDAWSDLIDDTQVNEAIACVKRIFVHFGNMGYNQPSAETLHVLIERLSRSIPPIYEKMDEDGSAEFQDTPVSHILQAGWTHWLGRDAAARPEIDFRQLNGLCNQALIQQAAIRIDKFGAKP